MNKKIVTIITIVVVLIILTAIIIINIISHPFADAKYKEESISSIKVTFDQNAINSSVNSAIITTRSDIGVFLDCIKKLEDNNTNRLKDVLIASTKYTINYTFNNGHTKEYTHIVYPTKKTASNPFADFFKLDAVIKQTNSLFLYDLSNISIASINYTNLLDSSIFFQNKITDKAKIEVLLNVGREDALINKNFIQTGCGITFYDKSETPKIICGFNISDNTYMLDDLCIKYPEIEDIIKIAKEKNSNKLNW